MINIKIRVDDFPYGIPDKKYYTKENLKLLEELENKKQPYYLGIVPFFINYQDIKLLKNLRYAEFCIHGFNHGFDHWRPFSEFKNMNEIEIEACLKTSLEMFELLGCVQPNTFIPPFNTFNQALLNVLNKYNFQVITGGPETISQMNKDILNFGQLKLILSQGKFYTSTGNFHTIYSFLKELPEDQNIVYHFGEIYDYNIK